MKFAKFTVLNPKASDRGFDEVEVLFNLDHIISIKPIRIATSERLVNGFWIRTSNEKKYKATRIPAELVPLIGEQYVQTIALSADADDAAFQ
jgi:hypothetical protein